MWVLPRQGPNLTSIGKWVGGGTWPEVMPNAYIAHIGECLLWVQWGGLGMVSASATILHSSCGCCVQMKSVFCYLWKCQNVQTMHTDVCGLVVLLYLHPAGFPTLCKYHTQYFHWSSPHHFTNNPSSLPRKYCQLQNSTFPLEILD